MNVPHQSVLLTLGVFGSALLALGALNTPDRRLPPGEDTLPALPQEIVEAEAEFAAWQDSIGAELAAVSRHIPGESPEEHRDRLAAWIDAQDETIAEQERWSAEIDRLYERHHIPPAPDKLEIVERMAPQSPEEAASPPGRRWQVERDRAALETRFADDPEALRDALSEWLETNGEYFAELERDERAALADSLPAARPSRKSPRARPLPPPPEPEADTPPDVQRMHTLEYELAKRLSAIPPPVPDPDGTPPPPEAYEAWREAVAAAADPVETELSPLRRAVTERLLNSTDARTYENHK